MLGKSARSGLLHSSMRGTSGAAGMQCGALGSAHQSRPPPLLLGVSAQLMGTLSRPPSASSDETVAPSRSAASAKHAHAVSMTTAIAVAKPSRVRAVHAMGDIA